MFFIGSGPTISATSPPPGLLTVTERSQLLARAMGVVEGTIDGLVVDVEGDQLRGVQKQDGCVIPRDVLFVPPQFVPNSRLLVDLAVEVDADGWVITDPTAAAPGSGARTRVGRTGRCSPCTSIISWSCVIFSSPQPEVVKSRRATQNS